MKAWMTVIVAATGLPLLLASDAEGAWPHYSYSAPVVVARPVPTLPAPRVVYRAPVYPTVPVVPSPTIVYRPVVTGSPVPYPPASPYPAAPVVYPAAPATTFWTPYGGTEVRVPGQPVRNLLRAVVP